MNTEGQKLPDKNKFNKEVKNSRKLDPYLVYFILSNHFLRTKDDYLLMYKSSKFEEITSDIKATTSQLKIKMSSNEEEYYDSSKFSIALTSFDGYNVVLFDNMTNDEVIKIINLYSSRDTLMESNLEVFYIIHAFSLDTVDINLLTDLGKKQYKKALIASEKYELINQLNL